MTSPLVSSVIIFFSLTIASWILIFSRRWRIFAAVFFLLFWLGIDLANFYEALSSLLGVAMKLGSELSFLMKFNV